MFSLCRTVLAASTRARAAAPWPYQRVVRAMEQEGKGLLVGAEVFTQFETFYRNQLPNADSERPEGSAAATAAATASLKPLTAFCGSPADVEPLAVLLLKVLCDLQRLEEMRFLFTQCLLELDCSSQSPPSVELFNVYLLAISMTDTFNQNEVENLVEIMQSKGVVPDIVTKFSMLILYLRLGHDACLSWLPAMLEEADAIVAAGTAADYPLLPLRIQHCFQTMLRLHCAPSTVHALFTLLQTLSPERLTPALLLPYLLLSINDTATPPQTVVSILQVLEGNPPDEASPGSRAHGHASGGDAPAASGAAPLLNSEGTIMKFLVKCAQWRDATSAAYVHAYLEQHRDHVELSAEARVAASLLYVEALVAGSTDLDGVVRALAVLEREVPREYCVPGDRPKLFLESRRMLLLSSHPVTNLVNAMGDRAPAGDLRAVAALLLEAKDGGAALVTATTLDLLMAAAAHRGDAVFAELLLSEYAVAFQARPTSFTYASLLLAYANDSTSPAAPPRGVSRVKRVLHGAELADAGVTLDSRILQAALEVALCAHDVATALVVAERHAAVGVAVPVKQGGRLLRESARVADADCARRALKALHGSRSVVSRAALSACVAELRRYGIACDDLM